MAIPVIRLDGSTSGVGTAGIGRDDFVLAETITMTDTNPANAGASFQWLFNDIPIGSSMSISSPTSNPATTTFDITGTARITCVVNGVDQATIIAAVKLSNIDARIPSFEEETEFNGGGNTKGWHEAMDAFMRDVNTQIAGVGASIDLQDAYDVGKTIDLTDNAVELGSGAAAFAPYSGIALVHDHGEVTPAFGHYGVVSSYGGEKTTAGAHLGTVQGGLFLGRITGGNLRDFTATQGLMGQQIGVSAANAGTPYTITGATGLSVITPSFGTNVTVTNAYGVNVAAQSGATNNYGIYVTEPTGGTINQAIWAEGQSTFGATPWAAAPAAVTGSPSFTNPVAGIGVYGAPSFTFTSPAAGNFSAFATGPYLTASNTSNLTGVVGISGVTAGVTADAGATGTVTGAASFFATSQTPGGMTFTNTYGLYVRPQINGTNNYGIYIEAPTGGTINAHLAMEGSTSGVFRQGVPATVTDYQITWPSAQAAGANYALVDTDGAGTLDWVATSGFGGTLDQAYDYGGAGAGRTITADANAVVITSAAADNNNVLEITKNPAGAQTGDAINITMAAAATGHALRSPGIHPIRVGTATGTPAFGYAPINVEDDTTNAWLQVYNGDSGVEGFLWSSSTVDLARFFIGTFSAHPIEFESATICLAVWDGTTTPPASTEQAMWRFDYNDGGSDYRTWGTGALALQRDFLIYNNEMRFDAPSTCDDAVTFEVTGPPKAGTNATITNRTAARILGTATVASAAAVTSTALTIPDYTTTLTGTTQMTATPSIAALRIGTQTITSGSAVTVDQAAALYIEAEPVGSGSTTLTESFAILAAPNSEARFLLGRMRIDSRGATPYWFISHADTTSTTDYAIKGSDGPTGTYRLDLNAGTFGVNFNIDGVEQARFHLNQFYPSAEGKSLGGNGTSQHWSTTYTNRLSLSDATNDIAFIEITDGDTAAVSAASSGRIRYNVATQKLQLSNNTGAYVDIATGAGGNTLDGAYDQGGAGVGRTINVTDGAVLLTSADADATNMLEIVINNVSHSGNGLNITTTGTGLGINSCPDTDTGHVFGRTRIDARSTDWAHFSHYDMTGTNQYAVRQTPTGVTNLNSATGQATILSINNSAQFKLDATNGFYGDDANGPAMLNEASSNTNPTLIPDRTVLTTGIGGTGGVGFINGGALFFLSHTSLGLLAYRTLRPDTAGGRSLGNVTAPWGDLHEQGSIIHYGATSGTLTHTVPATVTTYSVVWPSAQASGTQVLQNDGAGNLSWATAAGGGNTLDGAYDQGGAGAGRTINATDGAVLITSADADATNMLEIVINNVSHSGNGLNITTTGTGLGINSCENTDTGHVFGRHRFDARTTDTAYFSHYDNTATADYAIRQDAAGATSLNSKATQTTVFKLGDSPQFKLDSANGFYGNDANGPALLNAAAGATTPTILPSRASTTTGFGAGAANTISAIVNGAEHTRIDSTGTTYYGATTGSITHAVPASITTYTITWPSAQASGTRVLQNDGAGNLSWATAAGGGNTLDGAYDQGGAGAGRAITADAGAVTMTNTAADNNNVLELSKSPAGAQSGNALDITMSATATGYGISADPDADRGFVFGRALIDSRATNEAFFSHFDNTSTGAYAIKQIESGHTSVNAASGRIIYLRINNSAQFNVSTASGFYATDASGPALINTAAAATTPTILPNRGAATTGIGGASGEIGYVLGGAEAGKWFVGAANSSYLRIGTDAATLSGVARLELSTDVRTGYFQVDNSTGQMTIGPPTSSATLYVGAGGTPWRVSNQSQIWTQSAQSATPASFNVEYTYANHTSLTNAEVTDFYINNTHSVQFDGGAGTIATQRAVRIGQPTYDAASAGLSITTAATLDIEGAPIKGATLDSIGESLVIRAAADADGAFVFGRARVDARTTDLAYFSHFDASSSTQYALRQSNAGATALNAASGQILTFAINNSGEWAVDAAAFYPLDTGNDLGKTSNLIDHIYMEGNVYLDGTGATFMGSGTANELQFATNSTVRMRIDDTAVFPITSGHDLGKTGASFRWDWLYANWGSFNNDIDAGGGLRRTFWVHESSIVGSADTTLINGPSNNEDDGWIVCTRAGSLVEIGAVVNTDVTAGTIDVFVQKSTDGGDTFSNLWGSGGGAGSGAIQLDSSTNPEVATLTIGKDNNTFAAGDLLRIRYYADQLTGASRLHVHLVIEA